MPSPGGAKKQAGQELHQSGEENYIEIDMNPRLQQQRRSHARENGNSHKLELPHHAAAGRKDQAWYALRAHTHRSSTAVCNIMSCKELNRHR
jgi:hypothetical protein